MLTRSLCYIADMALPDSGQQIYAAVRSDCAGKIQRMAAVDVTFGYGTLYLPERIVEDMLNRTVMYKRDAAGTAGLIVRVIGEVRGIVSFGAIYICGNTLCHVATRDKVMGVVREGKMISRFHGGCIDNGKYNERIFYNSCRLRRDDTVVLHGRNIFDMDVRSYICSLVSMNIRRRSGKLSYKSNAEILDNICGVLRRGCSGCIDSAFTVISCVGTL